MSRKLYNFKQEIRQFIDHRKYQDEITRKVLIVKPAHGHVSDTGR
jgi:hypothetical protein